MKPEGKGQGTTTRTLGRDDWMTPGNVFDPLDEAVGGFHLDASATDWAASRCVHFITPEQDALVTPWRSCLPPLPPGITPRIWLNPPYGKAVPLWIRRAGTQAETGLFVAMLIFANTGTRYWQDDFVDHPHAAGVLFLGGRLIFALPGFDGKTDPAPKDSALLFFGPQPRPPGKPIPHGYWRFKNARGRGTPGEPLPPILNDLGLHSPTR